LVCNKARLLYDCTQNEGCSLSFGTTYCIPLYFVALIVRNFKWE